MISWTKLTKETFPPLDDDGVSNPVLVYIEHGTTIAFYRSHDNNYPNGVWIDLAQCKSIKPTYWSELNDPIKD